MYVAVNNQASAWLRLGEPRLSTTQVADQVDGGPSPGSRRDAIVAAAAALFAVKGVTATTVRDIGDAAGILSGSLYHHFSSKEEIVEAVVVTSLKDLQRWSEEVLDRVGDDPIQALVGLIEASFRVVNEHPDASAIYLNDRAHLLGLPRLNYLYDTEREAERMWVEVIQAGIDTGVFRSDLDPVVFYRFAAYPIWLSAMWARQGGADVTELARQHVALVLHGIARAPRGSVRRENGDG